MTHDTSFDREANSCSFELGAGLVWLLALLVLTLSCSAPAGSEMKPAVDPGPTDATCPANSSLSYDSFASDFFGRYCVRCHAASLDGASRHGAPQSLNYDTLEGILAVPAARIDSVAAASGSQLNTYMPPDEPRPSRTEREQLGEWLACDRP